MAKSHDQNDKERKVTGGLKYNYGLPFFGQQDMGFPDPMADSDEDAESGGKRMSTASAGSIGKKVSFTNLDEIEGISTGSADRR